MKKILLIAMSILCLSCAEKKENGESMDQLTGRVFERAMSQFSLLDSELKGLSAQEAKAVYPRSVDSEGNLVTSNLYWWCSGFFPGSLWYVYEYTKNEDFKEAAIRYTLPLDPLRFRTDDHDIGFQLMCSYGNGLRLTGNKDYEPVIIDGARSLGSRFNEAIGCTRSWNHGKWSFPVIIDNMMNMELLLKASELTGDESFKQTALAHARTTIKNHYREDYSCFHLVDYNPETGEVIGKQTVQGLADNSAWSRGQAWGAYGYTMLYRFTKEKEMLEQAIKVTDYQLGRLPEDGIPYWDYDSELIPDDVRDASAAAILASTLVELSTYVEGEKSKEYLDTAEKMLRTLASDEYLAAEGELHGFLLKHCTGHKPGKSEVDVPLTYADYYFLEALLRYRSLGK